MSLNCKAINIAIWGKSPISAQVASDIYQLEKIKLVALAGREKAGNVQSQNEAKNFSEKFGIEKIYGLNELIADKEIDLVYIAAPNVAHADLAIALMKSGKHVIVEKPMASTEREVLAILNAAKENNRFCMEAFMYQCHPATQHLLDLSKKYLGKLARITARYGADIYHLENPIQGGAIRNIGCYPLSLTRLLAKAEPEKIYGTGIMDEDGSRDTSAKLRMEFPGGLSAYIETSNVDKFYELTIEGENGRKICAKTNPYMQDEKSEFELFDSQNQIALPESEAVCTAKYKLYAYEFEVALDHIQRGEISPQRPGVTWEHSLGNARIIERWIEQIR